MLCELDDAFILRRPGLVELGREPVEPGEPVLAVLRPRLIDLSVHPEGAESSRR